MTKHEAAIVEIFTGVCMLTGNDRKYIYEYAEKLIRRPIMTHELLEFETELKEKSREDFINLCKNLTD